MTSILSPDDLLRLRVHALGLCVQPGAQARGVGSGTAAARTTESGPARIAETAQRMLAVQGQDWRSARWALGVRTPGTTVADVHAAFSEARIVRSWPMRGTIHVVAAEDIGWMQTALNHRVLAGAPKRRETIGLGDATLDRIVDVSLAALRGGNALDRDGLSAVWTDAGIEWQSGWRYHVIWWLCQNGLTTFGPVHDSGEPLLVRADEWITSPRTLTGDDALGELACRYTAARGPVTEKDFAWWTGLTVREARRALALTAEAGGVIPVRLNDASGPQYWVTPETLGTILPASRSTPQLSEWLLLPAFDEHLLGYTDRAAQLDPAHFDRIVPGRNGMFLATVVSDGRVRGTWRRGQRIGSGIELTALPGERVDPSALMPELARWCEFHGFAPLTFDLQETPKPQISGT
ncbi:winged helix DNA-binding protein [Leucobacter luti]|uniref:Winged helix DNA-binding protein n=1 Tax=Leucobacter luti TaxID=340320 RepID=A0A4R6RWM4_9MICO|nr:winged helix DNA-binding domain-containing protein [Leucobacter luti]TDP91452.1 winged helix DNA-binding protein [Leucobacter luti]